MFTSFDKALVPVVIGMILTVLSWNGITPDMTIEQFLNFVVASALVWLVPNKRA